MKKMLLLLYLLPTMCIAQIVKTKTTYQAYPTNTPPAVPIAEEIKTFNPAGQLIQITTMGIADGTFISYDTLLISTSIGTDSAVYIAKEKNDYNKPASIENLTYTNNQLASNTTTNYSIKNNVLDSTYLSHTYQYISKNKILKTTITNGITSTKTYAQDANGIKLLDRYNYKLDKKNRLIEKFLKSENKKTARIEKYTYYANGNRKELKILQNNKLKASTTYLYNAENKIIAETTKNINGKKISKDTITYQYTNGNCTLETTHINGETDTAIAYSYTFY